MCGRTPFSFFRLVVYIAMFITGIHRCSSVTRCWASA